MMPLTSLKPGQRAKVVSLDGGHGMRRRLASMGLTVGAEVESVLQRQHGPIVIAVRQTRLALGNSIAGRVFVNHLEK